MRLLVALIASALCVPRTAGRSLASHSGENDRRFSCASRITPARKPSSEPVRWWETTRRIEDTLRLEVALVDGKEMFAWPGSKQFEDRDLSDLVATGMFGNGNFAIYARILFLSNVAVFEDRGETQLGGRPAVALRFSSIALDQRAPPAGERSRGGGRISRVLLRRSRDARCSPDGGGRGRYSGRPERIAGGNLGRLRPAPHRRRAVSSAGGERTHDGDAG